MRLIDSHCHLNYAGLVERQEERGLPSSRRDLQDVGQRGVAGARHPGHDALVVGVTGHGAQLIARPVGDLHPLPLGQAQKLV